MCEKTASSPHDAIFKTFLSRVETARDFIQLHLPPALLRLCHLNTLKLESGSFLEEDLRPYYSDMLYSLKTTSGAGYIHVLIEHQSSADKHMAFRLMRYAIAAMKRHLDAGHEALPLVIPILFYQGRRSPYPWTLNWLDGFNDPQLARQVYSQDFTLVDITTIPDEDIMQHRSMAALTLIQKHIRQRDLAELLDKLASLLIMEHISEPQVVALVNYMLQTSETQNATLFLRKLAQRVPRHGDKLMTMAEQLENIGLMKGIEQGKITGEHQARLQIAQAMLENGLDDRAIVNMTGIKEEELQQLRH
ncbi:ISNCY family transposase [Superficieibacter electus]|uniref:ISNCY family transposase n=1 Tax=Superficieibacter electus TaxID=2022662 RepID=A0A2P5GJA6_9ENTR|nr:Rpn family recombination-promoting nuclease/putative transposase [Superficieibacter electus]POP41369.1 ISNCY family transposase [Superficieibacter electus]POP43733.1 ISNCY family transposase [Superficieibacter electus]